MKKSAIEITVMVSLVTAIAGAAYFVDDRYASAAAFEDRIRYTTNYHVEKQIEWAQYKLESLLLIPSEERRDWQKKEISRLRNRIDKLIRERAE